MKSPSQKGGRGYVRLKAAKLELQRLHSSVPSSVLNPNRRRHPLTACAALIGDMNIIETAIPGVLIIEPKIFGDARGFFLETFQAKATPTQASISLSYRTTFRDPCVARCVACIFSAPRRRESS